MKNDLYNLIEQNRQYLFSYLRFIENIKSADHATGLIEEGLEPHKVKELLFWGSETINYRSDITATFALKLAALRCHESQVREFSMKDPVAWLRSRCREMAEG